MYEFASSLNRSLRRESFPNIVHINSRCKDFHVCRLSIILLSRRYKLNSTGVVPGLRSFGSIATNWLGLSRYCLRVSVQGFECPFRSENLDLIALSTMSMSEISPTITNPILSGWYHCL